MQSRRGRLGRLLVLGAIGLLGSIPAIAGPPVLLNDAAGPDECPAVAALPGGGFVTTWIRVGPGTEIFSRLFDADLVPLGPEISVSANVVWQCPDVAAFPGGQFLVTWANPTTFADVVARRFDATGAALGSAFQVNSYTTSAQRNPAAATLSSGQFVLTWRSLDQDGDDEGVFARRYDATGSPIGGEFQVNGYTTGVQQFPAVASHPGGGFIIVWEAFEGTSGVGVYGQRYDNLGAPLGGEFVVGTAPPSPLSNLFPSIAVNDDGGFVVSWEAPDGEGDGIFARVFDTAAVPLGPPFAVNPNVSGDQVGSVAAADGSRFLILWSDFNLGFQSTGRLYDGVGMPLGDTFRLRQSGQDDVSSATRGAAAGEFLVAWSAVETPDDMIPLFARRLRPGRILGTRCSLRATAGGARRFVCKASERTSPNYVVGDPTSSGATLRVVTTGTTPSDQTFSLPATHWSAFGGASGYRYDDPTQINGPVRSVLVQRRSSGVFILKAAVRGTSPGVQLVPPNPGNSVVMALDLAGGETYCAGFGVGQGGGTIGPNDAGAFQVRLPSDEGSCPP